MVSFLKQCVGGRSPYLLVRLKLHVAKYVHAMHMRSRERIANYRSEDLKGNIKNSCVVYYPSIHLRNFELSIILPLELLRNYAESTLVDMVQLLFFRLPSFSEDQCTVDDTASIIDQVMCATQRPSLRNLHVTQGGQI